MKKKVKREPETEEKEMSFPCTECSEDIAGTVYVCDSCEKPYCEKCQEEHICADADEEDIGACGFCDNEIAGEKFTCPECGNSYCSEDCFRNHWIEEHQSFTEHDVEEYVKDKMIDEL